VKKKKIKGEENTGRGSDVKGQGAFPELSVDRVWREISVN